MDRLSSEYQDLTHGFVQMLLGKQKREGVGEPPGQGPKTLGRLPCRIAVEPSMLSASRSSRGF